ncbi:MAG: S9 family peptidase [Acidimicrobiia bacterium]
MRPDELHLLIAPSDPRLSPGGLATAFVVSSPDLDEDSYDRSIWIADPEPRKFTSGPGDTNPRWSPDGANIAFLRSVDAGPAQVAVIPVHGGEARILTEFEHGAEAVEWSPDGSQLAVVGVTPTEDWTDIDADERLRRPRRVTRVPYRFDARGWTHDRRRHIWLVNVDQSAEPRCLTPGDFDEESPAWSPDGERIAFLTDRNPLLGLASGNDFLEVDVASGDVTVSERRGFWVSVSYRPDGTLHVLGNLSPRYPVDSRLYRLESDNSLTDLTGHLDRSVAAVASGPPRIEWVGLTAVTGYEDSGRFGVISVAEDSTVEHVIDGDRVVTGFDVIDDVFVFTASHWESPGQLYALAEGAETQLTSFHSGGPWTEPEHFQVESDGQTIDVWVLLPDGDGKVPWLLNVHGGPAAQYGFGFFDEFQVYAGAGFGVVGCNPRGSSGKGSAFLEAVKGEAWGEVDLADIRKAVTASLAKFPRLDSERSGVMGGSYGGFMTAWIVAHEDRWQSAVVERALTNWTSFAGTSDIGGVFPENYTGVRYPDGWDLWWKLSPMSIVDKVTTPTLVLHSEEDWRAPIEQSEQYFMALLRNGTTTEFVRFPGEGHEMSRSGKPQHRKERFEAILEWHDRHLR